MPNYTYGCLSGNCEREFIHFNKIAERHEQKCPHCGGACEILPSHTNIVAFRAGYYEHVGEKGVYAETAEDLRKACEENGAYSSYLENSGVFKGNIGHVKEV